MREDLNPELSRVRHGSWLVAVSGHPPCVRIGGEYIVGRDHDGDLVIACEHGAHVLAELAVVTGRICGFYLKGDKAMSHGNERDPGRPPRGGSGAQPGPGQEAAENFAAILERLLEGSQGFRFEYLRRTPQQPDRIDGWIFGLCDLPNPPPGSPPPVDTRTFMAAFQELKTLMSTLNQKTTDALARLAATDAALAAKLETLITTEQQTVSAAVAQALADAGASDDQTASAVDAANTATQAMVDRITAVLAPPADNSGGNSSTTGDGSTGDAGAGDGSGSGDGSSDGDAGGGAAGDGSADGGQAGDQTS